VKIILTIVLVGLSVSTAGGQSVRRCAPTADSIARTCELDFWSPTGIQRNPPLYPDILRSALVEGSARLEFVVDASGRPLASTLQIRATHALFATAVRNAISRTRFELPRRRGLPVRVNVVEEVVFRHPGQLLPNVSGRAPASFEVDATGALRTTVPAYVLFDSVAAPRLTGDDAWSIYYNLAEHLMQKELPPPSAFCIEVDHRQPPAAFLSRWTNDRVVVPMTSCPRTYARMIDSPARRRAPPGWVDPVRVMMDALQPWAADLVRLEVTLSQGTGSRYYRCEVARNAEGWSQVGCVLIKSRMS
jgi:TonB family protein